MNSPDRAVYLFQNDDRNEILCVIDTLSVIRRVTFFRNGVPSTGRFSILAQVPPSSGYAYFYGHDINPDFQRITFTPTPRGFFARWLIGVPGHLTARITVQDAPAPKILLPEATPSLRTSRRVRV